MKARFYISSEKVQEVGYRAFIASKILESNLEGVARNLPDGRVEVLLEGEEKDISRFLDLIKEKPDLEFDESLDVPKVMRTSQALILDQLGKEVVYLSGIDEKMEKMRKEMKAGFD
ncbi:MAG: acylphosphatase, partial [Candidatus Hydrothermarchaeota archaeon]